MVRRRRDPLQAQATTADATAEPDAEELAEDRFLSGPLADISDFIYSKSELTTVLAAITSWALLGHQISTKMEALQETTDLKLLSARLTYTPAQLYELLEALGPEGRSQYEYINILGSLAYPFLITAFMSFAMGAVLQRAGWGHEWNLFPFVFFIAATVENAGVGYLLHKYPEPYLSLAGFLGMVTSMKVRFWWYNMLVLAAGCVLWGLAELKVRINSRAARPGPDRSFQ